MRYPPFITFAVTEQFRAENEEIIACELEAVINNNLYEMDWKELTRIILLADRLALRQLLLEVKNQTLA